MTGTLKTTCPYPHGTHPVYTRSSESGRLLFFLCSAAHIPFPDEDRGNTGERERMDHVVILFLVARRQNGDMSLTMCVRLAWMNDAFIPHKTHGQLSYSRTPRKGNRVHGY